MRDPVWTMPERDQPRLTDLRLLEEASRSLLGYFVHTWYHQYLTVIAASEREMFERGLIKDVATPTEQGRHVLFNFGALDLEKLSYILGIYVYILSCHKTANFRLMHRFDGRQVLYLRGYDYEGSVAPGGAMAIGFSSTDTAVFGEKLRRALESDARIFKVLSPKDVYWETIDAQRYFDADYDGMIRLVQQRPCSIYLNADQWRNGVSDLLDRMDHYIVYVSSITESLLWELEQLRTNERRNRVTVVFDEEAVANKELQVSVRDRMQDEYGERLIWAKQGPLPAQTDGNLRAQLAETFLVTTPDEFMKDLDRHRARIAACSSHLAPGARETWIDFQFQPAVAAEKLTELHRISAELADLVEAGVQQGIECLPLFLDQVQLRIYMTLLMGEHDQTGRALAAYVGVMKAALDYYQSPDARTGGLSAGNRDSQLAMLGGHHDFAEYAGVRLLAYGRSHQFDDFSAAARSTWVAELEAVTRAVTRFFDDRGRPGP